MNNAAQAHLFKTLNTGYEKTKGAPVAAAPSLADDLPNTSSTPAYFGFRLLPPHKFGGANSHGGSKNEC